VKISGIPVVDSTKPLKITITKADVKRGQTKDSGACAAAIAIKREMHATDARVHIGRTYVKTSDRWLRFETPPSLRSEIIAFDRGGEFEPGEHTLKKLRPSHFSSKRQGGASRNQRPRVAKKNPRSKHTGIRHNGANR
jgi:hypothetical protein